MLNQELYEFLKAGGGWAVAVLFIGISAKLYYDLGKRDDKMSRLLEDRHQQFVGLLTETSTALQSMLDFLGRNEQTFPRITALLERVERVITWCESQKKKE